MDAMLSEWAARIATRNQENWEETKKVMEVLNKDEGRALELAYREGYSDGFAALRQDYSKWMEDLDFRLRRIEDALDRIEDKAATAVNWSRVNYERLRGFD